MSADPQPHSVGTGRPAVPDPPIIVVIRAGTELMRLRLERSPVRVGRSPNNELVLDDRLVSRHHATIVEEGGHWWIRDAGSRKKLRVAHRTVSQHPLQDGDRVGIGPFQMLFLESSRSPAALAGPALTQPAEAESARSPGAHPSPLGASTLEIPGYRIVREIGRGGMGRVYEAVQQAFERRVALKVMLQGPFSAPKARKRFEREARIIGQLGHANIVKVHDFGEHAGCYWLSMELIEGLPLHQASGEMKLTLEQRLAAMAATCEAVGFAHARKVVHRDLKPGNILLSPDGQPHVLDFGLAKMDGLHLHEETLSQPETLLGTPAYMSPEQTERDPTKIDARSDVYSLGVVLYQLVTGQFPYDVQCRIDQLVHNIATVDPTPPSQVSGEVDAELETIILKALAKDPQDRYGDAAEMAADLRRRLAGQAGETSRAARTPSLRQALLRPRYRLIGAAVLATGVLVSVLALPALTRRGSRQTNGTADMAVAPAVSPAATPASMPALSPTSAPVSTPTSVPASAPASAPAVPRASPPVGALPSKEQLAADDEQGAQQRLTQLESSVDSQAYSRAYWVLRTLREHYAHTQVVKQAGVKLARVAVPILANVDEKKLIDRQQYWLAPPPHTAEWTAAEHRARQLLEKEADTWAGFILLRVVLQDEQAEGGYELRPSGVMVALPDDKWTRAGWRSSGGVLILGRKKGVHGAARARIEIGALHHYSPSLDLDFQEGQVVELGELVVGLPPRSERGTLVVTVRPEGAFEATGTSVVLGRWFAAREANRWALDDMNRCVVGDVAAGECALRCEGTFVTPPRRHAAVIRAGAITEVTLAALARRSVEIEWRFRDAANEGAWHSGITQVVTGSNACIPRNQGGAARCRLVVSDWDGSQCNIGAQNANLLRWPKAEFPADSELPTDKEFQRAAGQPAQPLEVGAVYVVRPTHGAWQALARVRSLGVAALAEPGATEPVEDSDEPPPEEESPRVGESPPPAKPGEVEQPQPSVPTPAPAVPSPHAAASKKELTLDLGGGAMLELVLIPAGEFMMGSPDSEQGRDSGEGPLHPVRISRAFYMGKYEVTQAQWQAVMGTNPSWFSNTGGGKDKVSGASTVTLPVDTVSWDECQEFCRKASQKTGKTVRLPTEAEWEYACRAGSTGRFCFGDSDEQLGAYAWHRSNSGLKTHPVGGKQANAWGLYDMHGNVWEWCQDWYGPYLSDAQENSSGPNSGTNRVLRGGCWHSSAVYCRSANRGKYASANRDGYHGFRVVVDAK
jgi:formylglycine-generating enzyme required for sulfatase activity/serine/threonine protein kinase